MWLMREQESARLKFLRRKFIEELEAPEKISVYNYGEGRHGGEFASAAWR